ncbi:MAG: hypothetical protein ACRD0K_13085 [Egibacteraceae bacterium]
MALARLLSALDAFGWSVDDDAPSAVDALVGVADLEGRQLAIHRVVGDGMRITWPPCHRRNPIRLSGQQAAAPQIQTRCPICDRRWTVTFPPTPPLAGQEPGGGRPADELGCFMPRFATRVNRLSASSSTVSQSDRRGRTSNSANSNRRIASRLTRPVGRCRPANGPA